MAKCYHSTAAVNIFCCLHQETTMMVFLIVWVCKHHQLLQQHNQKYQTMNFGQEDQFSD